MRIEFRKSFEKSLKKINPKDKEIIFETCQALLDVIEKQEKPPQGIGLKRLEKTFWEIRVNIHVRIIFEWQEDLVKFLLAGSHDEIKKFLRENG